MSFSSAGLGAVIDALTGAQGAGPDPVSEDELAPTLNNIAVAIQIISDTFDAAEEATTDAVTSANDTATSMSNIAQDLSDAIDRLLSTIIPHSLQWVIGYMVSNYIDAINDRLDTIDSRLDALEDWKGGIDSWRNDRVDPAIDNYVDWRQWFDSWPQEILYKWHDWFAKPEGFVDWVGDMLVGPTVSYLGDDNHKDLRDDLTEIMVGAWTETPRDVWAEIEEFLTQGHE